MLWSRTDIVSNFPYSTATYHMDGETSHTGSSWSNNIPILFQDLENSAQRLLPVEYNWYKYDQVRNF